ncbi:hypothetical protein CPC16_005547 [Podila verticillata]|nr:hypothetical protein CPC16_005547 [Podila verticillata]
MLGLQRDDCMFVITSASDNAPECALKSPSRIHCVDVNPCQTHLLELKLTINNLEHSYFWKFLDRSRATFDESFYEKGYSNLALVLFKWLVRAKGLGTAVHQSLDHERPQHAGPSTRADPADAEEEIKEVARAMQARGMVEWKALFVKHRFEVEAVGVRLPGSGESIDQVNMYASSYRGVKLWE